MTVEFPCHRERKRGDPLEKVRGIYSVDHHPPGRLLRRFASLAKTNKKVRHIERSEISHDQSEKYMPRQFFDGILHYRAE